MLDPAALAESAESGDPFALARLEYPGHKFIRVLDPEGLGLEFVLAIAPTAHSFDLLPDTQVITVDRKPKVRTEVLPDR
jgi:hypothetical protein